MSILPKMSPAEFHINNQKLSLLPERAVYWHSAKTMIVADMHFGKSAHFRKAGIPLSDEMFFSDMIYLDKIIHQWNPEKLIVVGDMFHSSFNNEVGFFKLWKQNIQRLDVTLVRGNHDIMHEKIYQALDIEIKSPDHQIDNFVFVHAPLTEVNSTSGKFHFFGHVHPKAAIHGTAHQTLRLPCFHFTQNACTLPAFSRFSGGYTIKPGKSDNVFVIAGNEVIRI